MPAQKPKKTFKLQKASDLEDIEFLPTGMPGLDKVIGGFPIKRITEIYGLEKVGKTTLTLMSLAALTQKKKRVIFIDVENSFNKDRAEELGVNLPYLLIAKEFILEDVAQLIIDNVENAHAIVLDSLPQLIPRREAEGEFGDANIGIKAKVINELMRRVTPNLAAGKCALIVINQLRPNLDPYGEKYITPGGYATRYMASLRLLLKSGAADRIIRSEKGEKVQVGHRLHVVVKKTKTGPHEGKEVVFDLMYKTPKPVTEEDEDEANAATTKKPAPKQRRKV